MSEKHSRGNKKFRKVEIPIGSIPESNEWLGFIVSYTSNGIPYGLTIEEWDEINSVSNKKKSEFDHNDFIF